MDIAHGDLYVNHLQEMSEQVLHKNIREIAGSKCSVWKMASFMCFNVIPLYRGGSNHLVPILYLMVYLVQYFPYPKFFKG